MTGAHNVTEEESSSDTTNTEVLAIVTHPPLLEPVDFPEDVKSRAQEIPKGCKSGSVNSDSESPSREIIRKHVAEYIKQRDGGIKSDWRKIILCAEASEVRLLSILSSLTKT